MKFFGWGRKKDPPPLQNLHQSNKPAEPGKIHGPLSDRMPGGASRLGAGIHWGAHSGHQNNNVESATGITPGRQQKPLKDFSDHLTIYSADEDEWLMMDSGLPSTILENSWEDRLQETIRFVFSHEQEGLLAIGTFALDQLAGALEKLPAATATDSYSGPVAATTASSLHSGAAGAERKLELRSSDEEDDEEEEVLGSHRQLFGRKRRELPVFGDHHVASVDSPDAKNVCDQGGCPMPALLTVLEPPVTVKQQLHNPSIEPLAKLLQIVDTQKEPFSGEEYYSIGVCGLFASKRSSRGDKSRRGRKKAKNCEDIKGDKNEVTTKKGGCSLGRIGRLFRLNYNGYAAKVAPEKRLGLPHIQGPPCIANRCDSGGENDPICGNLPIGSLAPVRGSSTSASLQISRSLRENWSLDDPRKIENGGGAAGWACDQDGKWIKTDSEFLVLEM